MKFESGYNVETVFDGSKLGIEPHTVEILPSGDLLILDSANSNLYRISSSLSLCKCNFQLVVLVVSPHVQLSVSELPIILRDFSYMLVFLSFYFLIRKE